MGPLGVVLSTPLTLFACVSHILLGTWFAWNLMFVSWVLVCVKTAGVRLWTYAQ